LWNVLRAIYRAIRFGPQDPTTDGQEPPEQDESHLIMEATEADPISLLNVAKQTESAPSVDPDLIACTTAACEVLKPEEKKKSKVIKRQPKRPPRVWLTEIFPFKMDKDLIHNDYLLKLRDREGPVVSAYIPLVGDVVVCIGSDFSHAYHNLKEEVASILNGFEFFFRLSMPREFTLKVTSDNHVNGFLRQSLTSDRFKGFIDLMRSDMKKYFQTYWNKPEMEIDIFAEVYRMVVFFLYRCLIGESTSEEFEEFYAAFKDLDVEEGLNSPGKIINNFTFGWWAINNKWKRWKKVVQKLVDREKPENSDLFFDLLTEKSKVDGVLDLGSLATRTLWIFFAGSANNFAAISWLLVLIYSPENRHILEELQKQAKEYNTRYTTNTGLIDFMTYASDPTQRSLLDRCIQEVVRMCAAALSFRKAMQDFVLDNGKESFLIREGTMIALAYGTVMNDPKIFSNVNVFNPDRYFTEGREFQNQIAFGAGRHPCTGRHLVSITVKSFLYLFFEYYDAQSPGKARDFFPQQQPVGIFRPPRPVMFKLLRKKEFDPIPAVPAHSG
jgi:cytochrome P450